MRNNNIPRDGEKKSISFIFYRKGFSLVEALVTLGLVAIIGAGIAAIITNAAKQQKGVQAKDQQRDVTGAVRELLSDYKACTATFKDKNPADPGFSSVTQIKEALGAIRFEVGQPDKSKMLTFTKFLVDGLVLDSAGSSQGNVSLQIFMSKIGDVGTVRDIKPDIITLRVKLDAGGLILECYSLGSSGNAFWQQSDNRIDIFFNAGNVGIGTTKPLATLNVASASGNGFIAVETNGASGTSQTGLLLVTKSNGTALGAGLGATGWELFGRGANWNSAFDGTQPNAFGLAYNAGAGTSFTHALSILPSGNVGIGTTSPAAKLDVAGPIRPMAAAPGNSCSIKGGQGYDGASGAPVYCDGTNWKSVGGGGGGPCVMGAISNNGRTMTCPANYYMQSVFFPRGDQNNASAQYAQFTCCPL